MRAIYDLGDASQSRFMHSSGQSGLPWMRHYRSFAVPWARVEYLPLWPEKGLAAHSSILTLKP
jgi:penicillin G amidase